MTHGELAFAGALLFSLAIAVTAIALLREVTSSSPLIGDDFWSDEDGAA